MLETPTAIDNAEAIAAIDGIDVLLIGTNDLCIEIGIPGELATPRSPTPMRAWSRPAESTASGPAWAASTTSR